MYILHAHTSRVPRASLDHQAQLVPMVHPEMMVLPALMDNLVEQEAKVAQDRKDSLVQLDPKARR